jgi:hypothetical protein
MLPNTWSLSILFTENGKLSYKYILFYLQEQTKEMKFNRQATLHQIFSFISKYKEEVVIFCIR